MVSVGRVSARSAWWALFILYTGLIYSTLGVLPAMWNKFNAFLGSRAVILTYTAYCIAAAYAFRYIYAIKKERSPAKYLLFSLFTGALFLMAKFGVTAAEKIHVAEYGLSGIILYNALKIDFDRFGNKLYIYGALLCLATGALDESMQGFLPNRYFDWWDIFLNGASGTILLLLIRFNILKKPDEPR